MSDIPANKSLNERKEENCLGITAERKYYKTEKTLIKRSLRPREWQTMMVTGKIHIPRQGRERVLNEAASMKFVKENSAIPVPTLHCCFEDDDAVYLVMEYIDGDDMSSLTEAQKTIVQKELEEHVQTMHKLHSCIIGGPSGLVVPPHRVTLKSLNDDWSSLRPSKTEEFSFCHNDLSQHNVVVDPVTLKINAILDWEYAGFYPEFFEGRFFERPGPSAAINDEVDDTEKLVKFLESRMKEDHRCAESKP